MDIDNFCLANDYFIAGMGKMGYRN